MDLWRLIVELGILLLAVCLFVVPGILPGVRRHWRIDQRLRKPQLVRAAAACAMWALANPTVFPFDERELRRLCHLIVDQDMIWWSLQDNAFFMDPPPRSKDSPMLCAIMSAWLNNDHSGHWKSMFASIEETEDAV